MKVNVGCGTKYMEGWVNADACDLFKRDVALLLPKDKLAGMFGRNSIEEIYMADVMEHFYRCDGIEVLRDFFEALKPQGKLTIVTPDLEKLITSPSLSLIRKTELIRGAQGQSGPTEEPILMQAWLEHPKWFSHPYTWTERELRQTLSEIGFIVAVQTQWICDWEMSIIAYKQ